MKYNFEFIDTDEAFRQLQNVWNHLLEQSKIASPFLTWEWMYNWWQVYGKKNSADQLAIIVAKKENHIKAILPGYLYREKNAFMSVYTYGFLGNRFETSDYLEIITNDLSEDLLIDLLDFLLKSKPQIDVIRFDNQLENDLLINYLNNFCQKNGLSFENQHHRICPYISINGTFSEYFENLSGRKKELKRKKRKLFNRFKTTVDWIQKRGEIPVAIDSLFALHKQRFNVKGEQTKFQGDIRNLFHKKISEAFLGRDILRLFQIKVDGKTIASIYCFEFANELFAFQTGMDPEWRKYSPQFVLWGHIIEYAFNKGLKRFDFMRGDHSYKYDWTDTSRNINNLNILASFKGRQIASIKRILRKIKGTVKKLIPENQRESFMKLLKYDS